MFAVPSYKLEQHKVGSNKIYGFHNLPLIYLIGITAALSV